MRNKFSAYITYALCLLPGNLISTRSVCVGKIFLSRICLLRDLNQERLVRETEALPLYRCLPSIFKERIRSFVYMFPKSSAADVFYMGEGLLVIHADHSQSIWNKLRLLNRFLFCFKFKHFSKRIVLLARPSLKFSFIVILSKANDPKYAFKCYK